MTMTPDILCIGSVLWDVIGRTAVPMHLGADKPGKIVRIPGGVALNIAMTLTKFGVRPSILSVVGEDAEGSVLRAEIRALGIMADHLHISATLPTDTYMAIEASGRLVAAIADAHSLEQAGARILRPLEDGTLGSDAKPWDGLIAVDGNLTEQVLRDMSHSPLFARADLRIAPASPGKAERIAPLMTHPRATFYVNLEEAGLLCRKSFPDAPAAARALRDIGAARVLVTNGGDIAAEASEDGLRTAQPRAVTVQRVTGAGDTFMAAHIASEFEGANPGTALARALDAAATYVSGDTSQ